MHIVLTAQSIHYFLLLLFSSEPTEKTITSKERKKIESEFRIDLDSGNGYAISAVSAVSCLRLFHAS